MVTQQYFFVVGTGLYFHWLPYPVPILLGHLVASGVADWQLPADDGREIGEEVKVKLESWQMKHRSAFTLKYN